MSETAITIYNALYEGIGAYCSFQVTDAEGANKVFKAMNEADEGVADMVNQMIIVSDVFVSKMDQVDKETGELREVPKLVLFDPDGKSYATISKPMYNGICNVCTLIGSPDRWVSPIVIKILQKKVSRGTMLTFEVTDWGLNFPKAQEQ